MTTFLITFVFFIIVIAAMAVGYIFQRKSIAGSCGGLSSVGIDKVCSCVDPCEIRKKQIVLDEQKINIREEHS